MNRPTVTDRLDEISRALDRLRQTVRTPADGVATYPTDDTKAAAGRLAEAAAALAGGQYRPAYNGWTSAETWRVHLWITNDLKTYNAAQSQVAECMQQDDADALAPLDVSAWPADEIRDAAHGAKVADAADALRDYVDDLPEIRRVLDRADLASDLLGAALGWVDWREVAEALAE